MAEQKKNLFGYDISSLEKEMLSRGESRYRAAQLFGWIYGKKVYDFSKMTDVSKSFRAVLEKEYCLSLPSIFLEEDAKDGTVKLLLQMEDGAKVEAVLMRYNYGNVACVSSQVGCNMGCAFCASGLLKKTRNLETYEMVGEVLALNSILAKEGESIDHVVVMGTGEPFDNFDNVMRFLHILNDPKAFNIGARRLTVSTCGIVPGIRKYAEDPLQINLAVSLHAPNDAIRTQIMPIARAYPLDQLIDALKYYEEKSGRRITFEYILIKGVNDSLACADELADLIHDNQLFAYVNLIPYNPVKEKPYARSPREQITLFHDRLMKRGINATVRKEFGTDIDAACGQLRAKVERGEKQHG